jgi:hypothetical protein
MADRTAGDILTVGSDYDFRNRIVLDYHARFLPAGRRLVYWPERAWPPEGPEWYLAHGFAGDQPPPATLVTGGHRYGGVAIFPYAGLSGWTWYLYRRQPAASAAPPLRPPRSSSQPG